MNLQLVAVGNIKNNSLLIHSEFNHLHKIHKHKYDYHRGRAIINITYMLQISK